MASDGVDVTGNGNGVNNEEFLDAEDGNCVGMVDSSKKDEGDALGNVRPTYGEVYAKMPVPKNATHYKMDHKNRGVALIFNHEKFEVAQLKARSGTNEDCKNLTDILKALGFDVHAFKDLNYSEIKYHIEKVARQDHSDSDCIVVALLTHGEQGILYSKDTAFKPDYIWNQFTADKCPTLAGKPKLFFMQACQGDKLDGGVNMIRMTETDGEIHNHYKIPVHADFLVAYSTVKGYYSWRNTTKGSWFIQSLCEELKNRAYTNDLLTILTFVSQRVALDFESNVPDSPTMHRQKQIPCVMTMLTRLLQFQPPSRSDIENNIVVQEKEKSKNVFGGIFNSRGKINS